MMFEGKRTVANTMEASIVFCFVDFRSARDNGSRTNFARVQFIVDTNRIYSVYNFHCTKFIYFETPMREKRRHNITFRVTLNTYFYFYSRKCIVNNPYKLRGNSDLYRSSNYNYPELMVSFDEKDLRVQTFAENYTCREKCK